MKSAIGRSSYSAHAFCQNPAAPLVLLEMPDFAARLSPTARYALLREEATPLCLIQAISARNNAHPEADEESREGRLHIALAGEIQTHTEGVEQIKAYWRDYFSRRIAPPGKKSGGKEAARFCDLLELGLLPLWAENPPPIMEPASLKLIPEAEEWLRFATTPDSWEEAELWAKIAPELSDQPELMARLRSNATESDLVMLADIKEDDDGYSLDLRTILSSHPNATPHVLGLLLDTATNEEMHWLVAGSPHASAEQIEALVHCANAGVRRLARRHPKAPSDMHDLSREAALRMEADYPSCGPFFERFTAGRHKERALHALERYGRHVMSPGRLTAALALPTEPVPFTSYEAEGCTIRDLLEHLTRDGNRLVRWAAQTRLQDSDFKFTWQETR